MILYIVGRSGLGGFGAGEIDLQPLDLIRINFLTNLGTFPTDLMIGTEFSIHMLLMYTQQAPGHVWLPLNGLLSSSMKGDLNNLLTGHSTVMIM